MGLQFLVVTCLVALPPALGDCARVFLQPKALGGLQLIEKGFKKTHWVVTVVFIYSERPLFV